MIASRTGTLPGPKEVYTTAEAAKLCCVHKTTVIAAINRGMLRSMKTPGGHNRVARLDLLAYMRRSGIAVPDWADPPPTRVLVVAEGASIVREVAQTLPQPRFEITQCAGLFEAGVRSAHATPEVLIMDVALGTAGWGGRHAAPGTPQPRLIGLHDGSTGSHDTAMFATTITRDDLGTALAAALADLAHSVAS